jgi:hypothetical protein
MNKNIKYFIIIIVFIIFIYLYLNNNYKGGNNEKILNLNITKYKKEIHKLEEKLNKTNSKISKHNLKLLLRKIDINTIIKNDYCIKLNDLKIKKKDRWKGGEFEFAEKVIALANKGSIQGRATAAANAKSAAKETAAKNAKAAKKVVEVEVEEELKEVLKTERDRMRASDNDIKKIKNQIKRNKLKQSNEEKTNANIKKEMKKDIKLSLQKKKAYLNNPNLKPHKTYKGQVVIANLSTNDIASKWNLNGGKRSNEDRKKIDSLENELEKQDKKIEKNKKIIEELENTIKKDNELIEKIKLKYKEKKNNIKACKRENKILNNPLSIFTKIIS